jgi:predicted transcriptional regulator
MTSPEHADLLRATVRIVAAYVSKNTLSVDQVAPVIRDIHSSLHGMGASAPEPSPTPAVPIRRSVKNDVVVCLECGKAMKMLKRHLNVEHGLSIPEYKAKWGLSPDHPVVAPAYAQERSDTAKRNGLGRTATPRRSASKGRRKGAAPAT